MTAPRWARDCLLWLPCDAEHHDPTRGRTDNVGSAGGSLHGTFGAGAAEPTKLTDRHGYSFDGGDHMQCSAGYALTSGLVSVMITTTDAPVDANNYCWVSWETGYGADVARIQTAATEIRFYCGGTLAANAARVTRANHAIGYGRVHTMVGVHDGVNTLLYINNELAATALTPLAPDTGPHAVWIGIRTGVDLPLDGNIYHAGMADFALSPLMVQEYQIWALQEYNQI